jgi:hypothetical protein
MTTRACLKFAQSRRGCAGISTIFQAAATQDERIAGGSRRAELKFPQSAPGVLGFSTTKPLKRPGLPGKISASAGDYYSTPGALLSRRSNMNVRAKIGHSGLNLACFIQEQEK